MLQTWSKIEIPPQPSKKAVIIILIETFFRGIAEIAKIPLVISTIPKKKLSTSSEGTCKIFSKGFNISMKLLCFNIEIITEKITINPPIFKIVEMELAILLLMTSPKLDKQTLFFKAFLEEWLLIKCFELEDFQNLKQIPTDKQDKRWVNNNNKPIVEFPKHFNSYSS